MRGRLVWIALLGLAACSDGPVEMERLRPQAAAVQNLQYFSFLPPLASGTTTAAFNAGLRPVVEVCHLVADECAEEVTRFETRPGEIEVDLVNEHYKVNWKIAGLTAGELYRIQVRSAPSATATVLGAIDLLGTPGGGLADPASGASRNIESTLPIKFRLEHGLLCTTFLPDAPNGLPCIVTAIGPAGGTVVNEDSTAGAYFRPGALSQYVNVVLERYEPFGTGLDAACLPTDQPQYGSCFRIFTDPYVPAFNPTPPAPFPVTVGVCPDPIVFQQDIFDQVDLYKWDEDPQDLTLVHLPQESVEFLNCPGTPFYDAAAAGTSGFGLARLLLRPLQPLLRLVGPTPAYAAKISPFGGGLNDFSRIGWLRPLALSVVSGNAQNAYQGTPVPNDPVVRVTAAGAKVTTVIPVAGVPITFAASGDGTAAPAATATGADGLASTVWTVPSVAGPSTLAVSAWNPLASATATDVDNFPNRHGAWGTTALTANSVQSPPPPPPSRYNVVFSSPLTKGKLTPKSTNVPGVPVVVKVCSVTNGQCWLARRVVSNDGYHFQWKAGAGYPDGQYRFTVLEGTTELGSFTGAVAKDGSSPPKGVDFTFQIGANIPIKFVLIAK